jgi:rhodanese-related sulfurtransferase
VRREPEFRLSHVAGATLLPLDRLAASIDAIPRDRPLVCICQKGVRSRIAAQMLVELGFAEVHSLEGGMDAWDDAQEQAEACAAARAPAACSTCEFDVAACALAEPGHVKGIATADIP